MARTQVQSELLATNSISGTIIADNAITATHIATNAISGTLIQDSGIVTTMIAANNITATKVVTNAIQTRHIADDQVTADKLANSINTSIAAKLPLAGGTMTGALDLDGQELKLDADADTSITADTDDVVDFKVGGTDRLRLAANNLFLNGGTDARIQLGSGGAGANQVSNNTVHIRGDGVDAKYMAASGGDHIFESNGGHLVTMKDDGNVGIGTATPSTGYNANRNNLVVYDASAAGITINSNATDGSSIISMTDGTGTLAGEIHYVHDGDYMQFKTANTERMRIHSNGKAAWSANGIGSTGTVPRDFAFYTEGSTNGVEIRSNDQRLMMLGAAGSGGTGVDDGYIALTSQGTTKIGLNSNGHTHFDNGNVSVTAGNLYVSGEGESFSAGSHNGNLFDDNGQSVSSRAATNNQTHKSFYNPNGAVGSITTNGSVTYYNTSSDYRLKENVVTDWDATSLLKQLKPSKFNFKADADTTIQGFLAHEVSSIVPQAVSGEKDAVYTAEEAAEDMTAVEGQPNYQSIDHSKLVPLLVKTIQELEARIETLEE